MPATLSDKELLARLVAFDTTSELSNRPLVDFVAAYLDGPGVKVVTHPSPDGRKAGLVAMCGPATDPGRRDGVMLCGHTDVVPADQRAWHSDPFQLVEHQGNLVGRGTCDMKGFLALAINLMHRARHRALARPLALLLTYDEELNTTGVREFLATWPAERVLPRDVVVGEPTELEVVHAHKGMLDLRLDVEGAAAHSGYPHHGRNAIEPAARAITALGTLRQELERERPANASTFAEVPYAALNVGTVRGGVAVNIVPDGCTVGFSIRLLPGMDRADTVNRVQAVVEQALAQTPHRIRIVSESPPMYTEADATVITDLLTLTAKSAPGTVSYATDAGWLQTAGHRCAIFGPGSITVAHKPNEYLPREQFEAAATILTRLVTRRCEAA
ncbi:MAG TPA: acetylornithine deacetylase [Gemmatimonadales bacterium]|jgi:acetylornithine deacetylase